MKKLFLLFAALCCMMVANAQSAPPDNQIWYTTTNGQLVDDFDSFAFPGFLNHQYKDGKGIITLRDAVTSIPSGAFMLSDNLLSISLPSTIQTIDVETLTGCDHLNTIKCFATTPPTLYGEPHPFSAIMNILVPDDCVVKYKEAWRDYSSLIRSELTDTRNTYLMEMNDLKKKNSDSEILSMIEQAIKDINAATSSDQVIQIRDNVVLKISLHPVIKQALADINNALEGNTGSAYLNNIVAGDIEAIKNASNAESINKKKTEAINKLKAALPTYNTIKAELLGTLGTPQTGPAIEVTDQNGKVVKLYNPKNAVITDEK